MRHAARGNALYHVMWERPDRRTVMSKRLALLVYVVVTLGMVSAPAVFAEIIIMADESCRTDVLEPDTNNHDSSKLSIRSDEKSAKSWIKFDISELDVGDLEIDRVRGRRLSCDAGGQRQYHDHDQAHDRLGTHDASFLL